MKTAKRTPTRKNVKDWRSALPRPTATPVATSLRTRLQLTQPQFAPLLPVSVRTLATLEAGTPPTEAVGRRLTELDRLAKALTEVIRETAIGKWLLTPNPAYGGLTAAEVIARGETDRIWETIFLLRSGVAY
ncbi:MAG: hypothetical protein KF873_03065 [Gemmataceae bacterium]|nr:hypothetical protein [Gemmataceae bacterium]